jgi:hypothetical protein
LDRRLSVCHNQSGHHSKAKKVTVLAENETPFIHPIAWPLHRLRQFGSTLVTIKHTRILKCIILMACFLIYILEINCEYSWH